MLSYSLLAGLVDLGVVAAGVEPDVAPDVAAPVFVFVSVVEPDFVSLEEPESVAGEVALSVLNTPLLFATKIRRRESP